MEARRISAVLCSGDLERSRMFYEQVVGLTLSPETIPNHLLFECGDGTTLLVYGRPAPNKADHTQVRFWTDDVDSDVRELESRGAVFEDYDFPTLTTVAHVATTLGIGKSAWFRTPTETRSPSSSPSSHFGAAHSVGQPRLRAQCAGRLPALCSIGLSHLRAPPARLRHFQREGRRVRVTSSAYGDSPDLHAQPGFRRMSHERSFVRNSPVPRIRRGGVCQASAWRRSHPATVATGAFLMQREAVH